eukprot:GHVL01004135.1.p1 GENE.GHVL01004135.1~~GHVL01004135.1.p1  ORF type:complete len:483 (+),score=71.25 GHVL01004135.1:911-2359(+)
MTEFVLVSGPNKMIVAETLRYNDSLQKKKMKTSILVNQMIRDTTETRVLNMVQTQQILAINDLKKVAKNHRLHLTKVPYYSIEVLGQKRLRAVGHVLSSTTEWKSVFHDEIPRLIVVGGKGGVGKTSTSAGIAYEMASLGYKVAVVSTDPAHSLGDSLETDLSGGKIKRMTTDFGKGELWAWEITSDDTLKGIKDKILGVLKTFHLPKTMGGFSLDTIFKFVPPGFDDIMSLVSIASLFQNNQGKRFDKIVVDTAPTGHALRLLKFPTFLRSTLKRAREAKVMGSLTEMIQDVLKIGGISELIGEWSPHNIDRAVNTVEDTIHNPQTMRFIIVTLPADLAVSETSRLAQTLVDEQIPVEHIVVNKVLTDDMKFSTPLTDGGFGGLDENNLFVEELLVAQAECLKALKNGVDFKTQVLTLPMLPEETKTTTGLTNIGKMIIEGDCEVYKGDSKVYKGDSKVYKEDSKVYKGDSKVYDVDSDAD